MHGPLNVKFPLNLTFTIHGQRFYQVVSLVSLARLAPSVAIQLAKFCCMFDYNFKNNPPYKVWQEKKTKYPPGY
jgi:hypothetical protein